MNLSFGLMISFIFIYLCLGTICGLYARSFTDINAFRSIFFLLLAIAFELMILAFNYS